MQYPNSFQNQQQSESAMEVRWLRKTIGEKDHGQQELRNYHMCVLVICDWKCDYLTAFISS